jgi:Tol biopolymer transport system component
VFGRFGIAADLWLKELGRGTEQRLITDGSLSGVAVWSPKGDRIAINSNRDGGVFNLYQRTANVTGHDELLLATANTKGPTQWSRDGRFLIYSESDPKTKWDIWLLPMDHGAERKPIPFLRSQSNEFQGQVSLDGHWIAYTSDESSQNEVYMRAFPASEREWKISIAGGEQPRWSGDGKELFFISPEGKMMAIAVKAVLGASALL